MIKRCKVCGKEFKARDKARKYCSVECRNIGRFLMDKPRTKKCPVCGKNFTTRKLRQKYCSEKCIKKSNRDKSREYYHKHKKPVYGKCAVCGKEFEKKDGREKFCGDKCRKSRECEIKARTKRPEFMNKKAMTTREKRVARQVKSMNEAVKIRQRHGLSYGQAVRKGLI